MNSSFQLATTAGLPMNSCYETDYCFTISESDKSDKSDKNDKNEQNDPVDQSGNQSKTSTSQTQTTLSTKHYIKDMETSEMKLWLKNWQVRFIDNDEIIREKFYDAIQTIFALESVFDATDEMVGDTCFNALMIKSKFPDWIKELRAQGTTEHDLREIIKKMGFDPPTMMLTSDVSIRKLPIASPAKRLLEAMVKKWAKPAEPIVMRQVVDPGFKLDDILNQTLPDNTQSPPALGNNATVTRQQIEAEDENEHPEDTDENEPRVFDETVVLPTNQTAQATVPKDKVPDKDKNKVEEKAKAEPKTYAKCKPKLPKLPVYTQDAMDPWQWLQTIKRILSLERCHDDDKLYVLQKAMAYDFLPFAKQLDKEKHTSETYISALEDKLRNPAVISQATSEFHQCKWNFDSHPAEFIRKLETMVIKVKGEPSPQEFIQDVLIRLPAEVKDSLFRSKSVHDIQDLTAALVNEYNIELRKRAERKESNKDKNEKRGDDRKHAAVNVNASGSGTSGASASSSNRTGKTPFRCYNCNNLGHSSRECRQPRRSKTSENPNSNKNEGRTERFQPAQLRMANAPTFGQSQQNQQNSNQPQAKESANLVQETNIVNAYMARAPAKEYSFMMNENQQDNQQVELITKIDPSPRNFPTVRLTMCYPTRETFKVGDVLLDTGACTSCIDYQFAQKMKAFIMKSNVSVRGIIADACQIVEGAAYAIMKHPKMSKTRIIKFQVMKDLEPVMVLGNRFADVYFVGMVNHGGRYQVNLRESVESEWLSPEIAFRFCTAEESWGLLNVPEIPSVNTIRETVANLILDSLPYSPWMDGELNSNSQFPQMEVERLHYIQEMSKTPEFENVMPIYLQIENNELQLAERLMKRMDPKLNTEKRNELLEVLMEFEQVFSKTKSDMGLVPWQKWPIKIDIGDQTIPHQQPYPCTIEKRREFQKIIAELIKHDIVEKSNAPGGSPAMLIGKPDGSFRLLNDLRAVNRLTNVIFHPMPRIDDCLEAIRGTKFFNMFDLYQGYFQIEIPPSERGKTVFLTPDGKYQYKRLPMGLACAPFEFQRLMNTVLNGLNYTECLGYFDDIPVMGKSWSELLCNTRLVLDRLRDWNLEIKTDKCQFGVTELVLLGHLVNGDGIRPDPNKVAALKKLPYPTSVKQLQSIMGCYNYFSRYIKNYSTLATPLYKLISKERKFKMLKQDHQALDELKNALIEETMLVHFDPELQKKLTVDASDVAVGGILLQADPQQEIPSEFESLKVIPIDKVKHWKPLYFFSQKLAKHQQSYSVSEKECLAVLVAIKKFKHYLDGSEFLVETDHHALCQLPKLKFKNQRMERWQIILSSFKYKVIYTKGDKHGPDCLSRYQTEWSPKLLDPEADFIEDLFWIKFINFEENEADTEINEAEVNEIKLLDSMVKKQFKTIYYYQSDENWNEKLKDAQLEDIEISKIILNLIVDPRSELHKNYLFLNNLLFRKPMFGHDVNRIVINEKILKDLFKEEHESSLGGHFGVEKTYLQISRRFWMEKLYEKVKDLCQNCEKCYLGKSSNVTYAEPSLKPVPESILERLEMDAQGPITFKNGAKKVILVLIDTLSRFVYAKLLPDQKSKTVIKFLDEYFSEFGFPSIIQTDRGRNFLSGDVENHMKKLGIKHEVSNAYHPQSQGTVERINRTIAERLRTSIMNLETIDLKSSLENAVIAINSSIHKIHRFSPYYLVFGRYLKKPIDLHLNLNATISETIEQCRKLARERLLKQQSYYQERLQSVTKRNPYKFLDLCYVKNSAPSLGTTKKLVNKFFGPFFVMGVKHGSVLLLNPENQERFTSNLELTRPHVGIIPEKLIQLKNELLIEADNTFEPDDRNEHLSEASADNQDLNQIDLNESNQEESATDNSLRLSAENQTLPDSLEVNIDSDSEKSTIIDENASQLNQAQSSKKRRKRKKRKYITANRQIMRDNPVISGQDAEKLGPVTRKRKVVSVNLIQFESLNKLNSLRLKVKNFEISAIKDLAILRALCNLQLGETLTNSLSLVLLIKTVDILTQSSFYSFSFQVFFDFSSLKLQFPDNFNSLNQSSTILFELCLKLTNLVNSVSLNLSNCEKIQLAKLLQRLSLTPASLNKLNCDSSVQQLTLNCKGFHPDCELTDSELFKCCEFSCLKQIQVLLFIEMPSSVVSSASTSSSGSYASANTVIQDARFAMRLRRQLAKIVPVPVIDLEESTSGNIGGDKANNNGTGNESFEFQWPGMEGDNGSEKTIIHLDNANVQDALNHYYDPLPEKTAYGLSSFKKSFTDNSPYPPPSADQGRRYCEFPAPKRTAEPHDFLKPEFFINAREDIKKDIEQSEADKNWFNSFIKEKLQMNVVEDNLDKVKFGTLRKGYTAAEVIHPQFHEFKTLITCILCEQVALNPRSCHQCNKIYCLGCAKWLQALPIDLELEKVNQADGFMCINQNCLVDLQTLGYPKFGEVKDQSIVNFFKEASFRCHRKFCEQQHLSCNILHHLQKCRRGPIKFKFDRTLQLTFMSGPIRDELNQRPKDINSLLPVHLKKQEPTKTIPQMWHERALCYAFLIKSYERKEVTPIEMRTQANFGLNHWNNKKRMIDPTEPLDEGEEWALQIGFPSCAPVPIPDVPRRWPTCRNSTIPYYLLAESETWRRWAKYVDYDKDSISTTSSLVLYSHDVNDPESPFILADPFERMAPAEAESVQDWIKDNFPSCKNPSNIYRELAVSTKERTVMTRTRKRTQLAQSFQNRPDANLPPMLADQLNVIDEMASTCPERELIFSISMFNVRINENGHYRPRPCWIAIMDANLEVVYETFVKYREVDHIDSRFHGLTVKDLKYARNLATARDQVIKFLACAKKVVGYGLINHLRNLGLSRDEIRVLHPKLRDMNNYYSPYIEHPMNIHAIAFLWFHGYTLPANPHSPVVETTTVMRLYLLQWKKIEKMAEVHGGIHNENCQQTCGNRVTSGLLNEFTEGIAKGFCSWPDEWKRNPRSIRIPEFNDNCILPDNEILKRTAELCKSDVKKSKGDTPQSRNKKIVEMLKAKRSAEPSESENATKSQKVMDPNHEYNTLWDEMKAQKPDDGATSASNMLKELEGWNEE
uniref:RNA-directed DNA polymerase n=1 Tax=Tetranychus urticae TaxID=32264 RepID=T1KVH5_TETUR